MGIDDYLCVRPPGSFAEICLACPIPGLNDSGLSVEDYKEDRWALENDSDKLRKTLFGDDPKMYV